MRSTLISFILLVCSFASVTNAATYEVFAGWEGVIDEFNLPQWYSIYFYPNNLTIAFGDSVTFHFPTHELHNVVFTNGVRQSESQPNGKNLTAIAGVVGNQTHFTDYAVDFSTGLRSKHQAPVTLQFIPNVGFGTFQYYCSLHPGMDGLITVLPEGEAAPFTPAEVNATITAIIDQLIADVAVRSIELMALQAQTGPQVTHIVLPDGTRNWIVVGGAMSMTDYGMQMFARFLPRHLEIHVGDTVTWIIGGEDPHWVFFNEAQTFPPLFAYWDELGPDTINTSLAYFNDPYALTIIWFENFAPLTTIPLQMWPNAAGFINSGLMFGAGGPPVFPSNISVKFTTTGSWNYSCPIHAALGMFGTVVVKDEGAPLCTDPGVPRTCATIAAVRGDPQFSGFLGQNFQVHGIDGAVYNLISDDDIQVNSLFSFIDRTSISCPKHAWNYAGLTQKIQCWSHAGSYLGAVGVMDKKGNKLSITAGTSEHGFESVLFNDNPISLGTISAGLLRVTRHSSHHLSVVADEFTLHIDNSDGFINLASVSIDRSRWSQLTAHGLLGQTWHRISAAKQGPLKHIEGEVDDYVIAENTLFGTNFVYNRFVAA